MSFSRAKPDAWAVNEELTSAQINQLDVDHANALDKTGDTLANTIEVVSGGRWNMRTGSLIKLWDGASIEVTGTAGVTVSGAGASLVVTQGFFTVGVAGTATIQCLLTASGGVSTSTIAASGASTFSGNVIMQGTGSLGSRTCNIQSGMDVRVKTGSRIYYENGASVYFDTTCGVDMLADIAFGTGHISSYPNGSSVFFLGAVTHGATSTETYAASSTSTHASGSTETWSSGATSSFNNTPSFTAGMSVSGSAIAATAGATIAGATTAISTTSFNISSTTTTVSSTTTNISSPTTTLSGTNNRLKLTARDVVRKVSAASGVAEVVYGGAPITTQSPTYIAISDTLLMQVTSPNVHKFSIPLDLPHNSTLKTIEVEWIGNCTFSVFVRRNGFNVSGTSTTSSGTVTLSPNIAVDRTVYSYVLELQAAQITTNEYASITSIMQTCTVSEYAEG